ncbi:5801_t:CDS:2, partial [Gigaspora rosea]
MPSKDQNINLENWKHGQLKLISATTAFGMGLNVNDIRAIIHTTFPMSIDALVQETGRTGRNEMAAKNIIIDEKTCPETNSLANIMQRYKYLQRKQNSIFEVVAYCESAYECRQQQA